MEINVCCVRCSAGTRQYPWNICEAPDGAASGWTAAAAPGTRRAVVPAVPVGDWTEGAAPGTGCARVPMVPVGGAVHVWAKMLGAKRKAKQQRTTTRLKADAIFRLSPEG